MSFLSRDDFQDDVLRTMIEGQSALSVNRLRLRNRDEAVIFLKGYGYDLNLPADEERLWSFHRRAITYIETQLLNGSESLPWVLVDRAELKDLAQLLLIASEDRSQQPLQKFACSILRVMHVMVHLSNDLFTFFSDPIQEQVLRPYQEVLSYQNDQPPRLKHPLFNGEIQLEKFEVKPFKTSNSSVTKLLAKADEVAFALLDKIGLRFVTTSIYDCFRVLQFLHQTRVVSFAHLIPDQSNNTLYPLNLFLEVLESQTDMDHIEQALQEKLKKESSRAHFKEKLNVFTSRDFRFMKMIARQMIKVKQSPDQQLTFFYPYEIQIVDSETYHRNDMGPGSHDQYKSRQRERARERVFQ